MQIVSLLEIIKINSLGKSGAYIHGMFSVDIL